MPAVTEAPSVPSMPVMRGVFSSVTLAAAIFSSSRPLTAKGSNGTPAVNWPPRSAFQPNGE